MPGEDHGQWVSMGYWQLCNGISLYEPFNDTILQTDNVFPGESKKICFRVTNNATEDIDINITLVGDDWNTMAEDVNIVFTGTGTALASQTTQIGYVNYTIKPDANGTFDGTIEFTR